MTKEAFSLQFTFKDKGFKPCGMETCSVYSPGIRQSRPRTKKRRIQNKWTKKRNSQRHAFKIEVFDFDKKEFVSIPMVDGYEGNPAHDIGGP